MYLSRVQLNISKFRTKEALGNPAILHGIIEKSFEGERKRNLWRIDRLAGIYYVLLLSETRPELGEIDKQLGYDDKSNEEIRDYQPIFKELKPGDSWQFRLKANPTRSSFNEKNSGTGRGKVFAHVTVEQQKKWLQNKAQFHGFSLDYNQFDVVNSQWYKFSKSLKSEHRVSLLTTTFEGRLRITDHDKFKEVMITGVGRAKAYGCGLITLAR
jgi:CRISPR system Cascade subunit CasE